MPAKKAALAKTQVVDKDAMDMLKTMQMATEEKQGLTRVPTFSLLHVLSRLKS